MNTTIRPTPDLTARQAMALDWTDFSNLVAGNLGHHPELWTVLFSPDVIGRTWRCLSGRCRAIISQVALRERRAAEGNERARAQMSDGTQTRALMILKMVQDRLDQCQDAAAGMGFQLLSWQENHNRDALRHVIELIARHRALSLNPDVPDRDLDKADDELWALVDSTLVAEPDGTLIPVLADGTTDPVKAA